MLDLYDEFAAVIAALEVAGLDYAVCGGLAMAIHGLPRATVDVDLIVPQSAAQRTLSTLADLGYDIAADPMSLARGGIEIRRVSKADPAAHELLSVDLLLVTPVIAAAWASRLRVRWEKGDLWVVSRQGLIDLKRLRSSGQDQDDIKRLEEQEP